MQQGMKTKVLLYGVAIAAGAFGLRWLEYLYAVRVFSTEIWIALIAFAFTVLGIWVGRRLTQPPAAEPFEPNEQALAYLGVSPRERQVLALLAEGLSNDEIAGRLFVSPNTVKTHLARLYDKLGVARRTQAVAKARELGLIA